MAARAQRHPERVRAMVLVAVTSGRRRETEWITRDMRRVLPREWDAFAAEVPESERGGDLAAAYARLLASPDPAVVERAARAWSAWEDAHVSLAPGAEPSPRFADPEFRQVFARLVTHYWANGSFLDDTPVLAGMDRIGHPAGRADPRPARRVRAAGHRLGPAPGLAGEPAGGVRRRRARGEAMMAALVEALDGFRDG